MPRHGLLRAHSGTLMIVLRVADLAVIPLALWMAHPSTWNPAAALPWPEWDSALVVTLLCAGIVFERFSLYRPWRGQSLGTEVRALLGAWLSLMAILALIHWLLRPQHPHSAWQVLAFVLGGAILLVAERLALRLALRELRRRGLNQRHAILVGMGVLGAQVHQQLSQASWAGIRMLGYFDDRGEARQQVPAGLPCLGRVADLASYLQSHAVDQVWICLPLSAERRVAQILHELRHSTADIRYALDVTGFNPLNYSLGEVAGIPVLNISATPLSGGGRLIKEVEDRVLAVLALALLWPLMLAIAIGVRLSSPGPVFYRQTRVSWNGKPFEMLKFRSMPLTAESGGPQWTREDDRRATGFGRFLRRSSFDELPQFINVLRGEMSVVGPRPERPFFVEQFKDRFPGYMKKHMVKGGITGWAQVHGWRGNSDLAKRLEFDLYYIEHWSLWLDLRILVKTVAGGFLHKNAY